MGALQLDNRGVLTTCSSCGQTNRLPYAGLGKTTRCGQCKTPLRAPDAPIEVPSADAFDALVRTSSLPVVVDFWAPWCGPCRMVAPEIEKVAKGTAGDLLVVKVNTEALPELGERFGIRSIPTMAVFREGREVTRTAGARPAADIQAFVRQALLQRAS
ncbi:MAG: thioredoxin TrxC [Vicinamibacterales bacterium]